MQAVYISLIFLPIPIKENVILNFNSHLQEWERKMWNMCGLLLYLWLESSFLRGSARLSPIFSFPNVTAFSPFSLLLKPLSGVQLNVWAGLALPKGKLRSCLSSLIYEASKGPADQKYLHHWPAISAWNFQDKNQSLIESFLQTCMVYLGQWSIV